MNMFWCEEVDALLFLVKILGFTYISNSQKWLFFAGDCPKVTEYLAERRYLSSWGPIKFIDALLRGYGQVVYANNPVSGALVLLALTIADFHFSIAGLTTSSAGLFASLVVIPQSPDDIQQGLTVYNPLLIGLITASALPERYGTQLQLSHWFLMVFAAVLSVYVTSAFSSILGSLTRFPLPCFTLPFNVVQPVLFLCIVSLTNPKGRISSAPSLPLSQNMGSQNHNALEDLISTQGMLSESYKTIPTSTQMPSDYRNSLASLEIPNEFHGRPNLGVAAVTLVQRLSTIDDDQETTSDLSRTERVSVPPAHKLAVGITNTYALASKASQSKSKGTEATNRANRDVGNNDAFASKSEDSNDSADFNSVTNMANTHSIGSIDGANGYIGRNMRSIHISDDDATQNTDWGEVFSGVVLSMSRVYGSNHAQGAILIYGAVLLCSPTLAAFALIGATIGTLTGLLLTDLATYTTTNGVYQGGWGSNGLLCAMAIGGYYFVLTWQAAITAIFSAIFATVLQFVLIPAFADGNLYPMSLPFNLSALLLLCVISPGAIVRPSKLSFPEKHRSEHKRRYRYMQALHAENLTQEMESCEQQEWGTGNTRLTV